MRNLLGSFFLVLCFFVCSPLVFASEVVTTDGVNNMETVSSKTRVLDSRILQIDIAAVDEFGVSRNSFSRFNVDFNGIYINNKVSGESIVRDRTAIGINRNLREGRPAKIIVIEIADDEPSEILGNIEIIGEPAEVIVKNSKGIKVNYGKFINAATLTLEADKVVGSITIGVDGIDVAGKSLVLDAGEIIVEGSIVAKKSLKMIAHRECASGDDYAMDIKNVKICTNEASLVTTGPKGNMKLLFELRSTTSYDKRDTFRVLSSGNIVVSGIDVGSYNDFKFKGNSFINYGSVNIGNLEFEGDSFINHHGNGYSGGVRAENIKFKLRDNFINIGRLSTFGDALLEGQEFYNYGEIEVEGKLRVKGGYFANDVRISDECLAADQGGRIEASMVNIYLSGKRNLISYGHSLEDVGFYQNFDAYLISKNGIEIASTAGSIYLGNKRVLAGVEYHPRCDYERSKLSVREGDIRLQSERDIIFDGSEVNGEARAEAKGKVIEKNPVIISNYNAGGDHEEGSYMKGEFYVEKKLFIGEKKLASTISDDETSRKAAFSGAKRFISNAKKINYYDAEEAVSGANEDEL